MTRRTHRILLTTILTASLVAIAFYAAFEDVIVRDPVPPDDPGGMVRWLGAHPADWLTASVLTDRALDSSLPRRFEVWRAAHALATRLAPERPNGTAAFVRSGLFHWYELGDGDRRLVLDATPPLLRDDATFQQLAIPLWMLTRNFALLRRANPGTPVALGKLRDLAITNGLFDDYRAMREEVRAARLRRFEANPTTDDWWGLLPRPIEVADEPLIRRILVELRAHPIGSSPPAPFIDYVLRHHLTPLEGLAPAVGFEDLPLPLRARLAHALGPDRTTAPAEEPHAEGWTGLCGTDICNAASIEINAGGRLPLELHNVQSDEVPPYAEILVDDALVAEGPVVEKATFDIPLGETGLHKVDVRIANPMTRNRIQRRVALSSRPPLLRRS